MTGEKEVERMARPSISDLIAERDDQIEAVKLDALEAHGFLLDTDDDEDGEDERKLSPAKLTRSLAGTLRKKATVKGLGEWAQKTLTRGRIAQLTFPTFEQQIEAARNNGRSNVLTDKEWESVYEDAWVALIKLTWEFCTMKADSKVQQYLDTLAEPLVVVNAKTHVDGEPKQVWSAFVTRDPETIRTLYYPPLRKKPRSAASAYGKGMAVAARVPELREEVLRELSSGMKDATKHAKETLALEMGSVDGSNGDS
jgi:hypothetical protein